MSLSKRSNEKPMQKMISNQELIRRIEELNNERIELKILLNQFQGEFFNINHRRIRYHRDIEPVKNEYKRYKEIKFELSTLVNNDPRL